MVRPMTKKYTYDAFISYRHKELDKFVAENLHKQMEAFKLPGSLRKKKMDGRTKIERVFRDKDELPLTNNLEDPIRVALEGSEYLIVICTPRLKESIWCRKEIETFISMHGRDKIFAVLAEGEPDESFPEELLYREKTITKPDGSTEVIKEPVEPLAADVRGKNKRAILKAMRNELPRLLAPMFGITYDDLKQRHKERRMKRILAISMTVACACLIFGAVSTTMALRIQKQKTEIEDKNTEIQAQNAAIIAQQKEIRDQNEALANNQALNLASESQRKLENGDRVGAVQTAIEALTEYEGIEMPYTAEAQYALTEALRVYNRGEHVMPEYQIEFPGVITETAVSYDGKYALVRDTANVVYLLNVENGNIVKTFDDVTDSYNEGGIAFVSETCFVYIMDSGEIAAYDMAEDKHIDVEFSGNGYCIAGDGKGQYYVVITSDSLQVFDAKTFKLLHTFPEGEGWRFAQKLAFAQDEDYDRIIGAKTQSAFNADTRYTIYVYDLKTGEEIDTGIEIGILEAAQLRDGQLLILSSKFTNINENYVAQLDCYDFDTFDSIWEKTFPNTTADFLLNGSNNSENMIVGLNSEAIYINRKTGEERKRFPLGASVAGGHAVSENSYAVVSRDGVYHFFIGNVMEDIVIGGYFEAHASRIERLRPCYYGYIVTEPLGNKLTKYLLYEPVVESQPLDVSAPDTVLIDNEEALVLAKEKGYDNASVISKIFYNEDKSLVFVGYRDASMAVYDAKTNEKIHYLNQKSVNADTYFGKDKNGNYYVGGKYYGAYVFNSNHELIGFIHRLRKVDAENNTLIVVLDDEPKQYVYPIYSVEELISMGKEDVAKYTQTK